jgi:YbbR domain-containing protein
MRGLMFHNWKLKLLALALASVTFYVIRGKTSAEASFDLPVQVEVEKGIAILDQEPRSVQVTFRGSQGDLRDLDPALLKAVIRPKAEDPRGSESVRVHARNVQGAAGVIVDSIRPARVLLTFDREISKRFPVARPKLLGKPLIGRAEVDYSPREVTIHGPRHRLGLKDEVYTEPVDITGRIRSFSKKVAVVSGDPWIKEIEPAEVTVHVTIVVDRVKRGFGGIPVHALVDPGRAVSAVFEPAVVQVTLHGQAEVVDAVATNQIRAFVDAAGVDMAAVSNLPAVIHLPPGVDVTVSVEPPVVRVRRPRE